MAASPASGFPPNPYRGPDPRILRQGDVCLSHWVQLRAGEDAPGPGPIDASDSKTPFFGEAFKDEPVSVDGSDLTVRVWAGAVMIVSQGCELDKKSGDDSRVLVAPVVTEPMWPGVHWDDIRRGARTGYLYLPAMDEGSHSRAGAPKAWPVAMEAAVALASTSCIGDTCIAQRMFGLSHEMQHVLQERLVVFLSVRGWAREAALKKVIGRRIVDVSRTDEKTDGPASLYKMQLDGDEELTVAIRP
jgi:hypothetical protein